MIKIAEGLTVRDYPDITYEQLAHNLQYHSDDNILTTDMMARFAHVVVDLIEAVDAESELVGTGVTPRTQQALNNVRTSIRKRNYMGADRNDYGDPDHIEYH